ncbi:unnamed protein product [Chondrus crispus]|uniref:ABC1 atypical kinase-like domain-containing protein n=1 Tax=Chondrus crispus TaxID=2769 RepID=R7QRH5_CHOCR|nr:unnamed protein product [Chondrus crispus]CDF40749.1 unnamed protein product [Chondrus crispus]|eukprot:XP_005711043.1 unnamed protein product [Chondrus crispus]
MLLISSPQYRLVATSSHVNQNDSPVRRRHKLWPNRTMSSVSAFVSPFIGVRIAATRHTCFAEARRRCSPSGRRLCISARTADRQTTERGFQLLKTDVSRLKRLARGDLSAFVDRGLGLQRYDPIAIAKYYDARPLSVAIRLSSVGIPFLIWLFRVRKLDKWRGISGEVDIARKRADDLRKLLTWAGPTYLKIGQAVGNRPDLVGAVYSTELQKLVDDVGTFESDIALNMVKEELGLRDISDIFAEFQPDAVASASLGQVHKARLKSGEELAVKVQRPTVERDAALDVYVLRRLATFAKKRFKLRSNLVGIVDEFATRLWEELDYVNEAKNCERFDELYAKGNDNVHVPKVYKELTTKRILCMEWIDGDKAPWFPKDDAKRLIGIGVQCSLQQLLDKGFVHADPHGGNLLRTKDGKLCYLDFGMCVEVEPQIRYDLVAAIVRLINRDYENLGKDFVKLGFLPPDADTAPLAPLLAEAFGDASTGSSLSDLSFSRLADNLSGLAYKTPIRIPVFFTLIIRSLTILEGFALQTNASFKIVDEAYPYVVRRILTDESPVFQRALEGVLIDPETERIRWSRLKSILKAKSSTGSGGNSENGVVPSERNGESRLSGMSSSSLKRVVDFTLSERGEFLRKALQLELTDTADAAQLAVAKRISDLTNGLLPSPREKVDTERLENAIELAKALRSRVPEILAVEQSRSRQQLDRELIRQQRLRREVLEASRAVAGNILIDTNER